MANNELANFLATNLWQHVYGGSPKYEGINVGLELEVEGDKLPQRVNTAWRITRDGSLRGDSAEYVTAKPIPIEGAPKVLAKLWDSFKENNTVLNKSYRTSFHVHTNVQDLSILQTLNVFFGFLICEPILERVAGDNRVNNVFCLTPRENSVMFRQMYQELARSRSPISMFMGDALRYSSINMCSLAKFGTIEIRLMSGLTELDKAVNWTLAIGEIVKYFSNPNFTPASIVELPSVRGITDLMYDVFQNPNVREYLGVGNFEQDGEQCRKVYEACRQIQAVAYDFQDLFNEAKDIVISPKPEEKVKPKNYRFEANKRIIGRDELFARPAARVAAGAGQWIVLDDPRAPLPPDDPNF